MTEQKCAVCEREAARLRECVDGVVRCVPCRQKWLAQIHAAPVRPVPASVGRQERFA